MDSSSSLSSSANWPDLQFAITRESLTMRYAVDSLSLSPYLTVYIDKQSKSHWWWWWWWYILGSVSQFSLVLLFISLSLQLYWLGCYRFCHQQRPLNIHFSRSRPLSRFLAFKVVVSVCRSPVTIIHIHKHHTTLV